MNKIKEQIKIKMLEYEAKLQFDIFGNIDKNADKYRNLLSQMKKILIELEKLEKIEN
jgi:hypothetical protein